jgi:hypothetical protein
MVVESKNQELILQKDNCYGYNTTKRCSQQFAACSAISSPFYARVNCQFGIFARVLFLKPNAEATPSNTI